MLGRDCGCTGGAGSCSAATLGQIAAFKGPHLHLDTDAIARGEAVVDKALAWARDKLGNGPILLSASDNPDEELQRLARDERQHPVVRGWGRPARGRPGP